MARQVTLAAGLHMVRIRDDVVILDLGADRYSCLVGGGNQLTPVGSGAVSADDDVLQELQSAGLIAPDPGGPTCRTPVTPRGELTAGIPGADRVPGHGNPDSGGDRGVPGSITGAVGRRRRALEQPADAVRLSADFGPGVSLSHRPALHPV